MVPTTGERFKSLRVLLDTVEAELAEVHFSSAIGKFSEAVNISRGVLSLEITVVSVGVKLATDSIERNWSVSRSLLMESEKIDSKKLIPSKLWDQIQEQEREQAIHCALHAADDAASSTASGLLPPVKQRLSVLLSKYPGEARLQTRLLAVEALMATRVQSQTAIQVDREAKTKESERLLAGASWARAREFQKSGFDQEALQELLDLQRTEPSFPGLDEEMTRCRNRLNHQKSGDAVTPIDLSGLRVAQDGSVAPTQTTRPLGRSGPKERMRTLGTVAFVALCLMCAGLLIWLNTKRPSGKVDVAIRDAKVLSAPQRVVPAEINKTGLVKATADDQMWARINPDDADSVEGYLRQFPNGAHRDLAVKALADIRVHRRKLTESEPLPN